MGKAWKRHTHHKRYLTERGREAEIGGVATRNWPALPVDQETLASPEAPPVEVPVVEAPVRVAPKKTVVEAPVRVAPKKTTRRSTKKSTK
jgi:hypothetical protein